jgi:cytochrome c-type biogenesis protein CcmE
MPTEARKSPIKFIVAAVIILGTVAYLSFSGGRDNKDYYVTIGKMRSMGDAVYTRHLRVGGFVVPGSIQRSGPHATFQLTEQTADKSFPECKNGGPDCVITISYTGEEPPPDTFKDNAQALAVGTYGHDGVFHANELQAKCASKYAPATPAATPTTTATALPVTH